MLTEHTYPLELLRAELKSAMSEQLVQLMDRFASKQDLASFRGDFSQHQRDDDLRFNEINGKLDQLLTEKSERAGATTERKDSTARRWVALGVLATLGAGVFAALAGFALHSFFV